MVLGSTSQTSPAPVECVRAQRRCSSGVTTSAGGTQMKLRDASFRSAKANVPKQKGRVSAGRPHGPKNDAIAPNSNAEKAAHAMPNDAERQVNT